ncbi:MAG TPA: ribokinase [Humibacter sp.]|nr:ribokinase [Humibacter sp.]
MSKLGHPLPVIVVGSINVDLVVRAPRVVEPGETISGSSFSSGQGGKGANQASAAASTGARVHLIGRVGDDSHGADALAALASVGVDTTHVTRADAVTGVALIQVTDQGENAITVVAGANAELMPADVDRAFGSIASSEFGAVVVLCLEIPLPTVTHAAVAAAKRGWSVVLNPAPAPTAPLPRELLAAVDVLVPNEYEAAAIDGIDELAVSGSVAIVVTRGRLGADVHRGDQSFSVPAPRVNAVDTTGAGDAFIGVLAASLAEGRDLDDTVRRAVVGGAIATLAPGARGSLPTASAIDRLLAR